MNSNKHGYKNGDAMRAHVQKPIQSLQTFRRHFLGGSFAALPSNFICTAAVVLFLWCVAPGNAQQPDDSNTQHAAEQRLDALFNKIMQTMPNEVRERVDSASTIVREDRRPGEKKESLSPESRKGSESERRLNNRLNELPDNLKTQVEETIAEMQQRNEKRKAQFRESRKRRHK